MRARRGDRIITRLAACSVFVVVAASAATGLAAVVGETRSFKPEGKAASSADQLRQAYRRPSTIPFPTDNPYTIEKVDLGKKLFFDTRLSKSQSQSCATCHNPSLAWGDGLAKGVGHNMKQLGRRSPTIINGAYLQAFMWDSRFASLEEQALGPIQSDVEMNMSADDVLARVKAEPRYIALFAAAFPGEGITMQKIGQAIATYERTVVSGRAPFDAWVEGNDKAISESAQRGFAIFNTKANCSACHTGWNFTDDSTHDIGLPDVDIGRGKFLPDVEKMRQAFKTPGLREISRRWPYMHDGSVPTLEAVIDHYDIAGVARPSRSDTIRPLGLTAQEKADLVAFMQTLTTQSESNTVPNLPR